MLFAHARQLHLTNRLLSKSEPPYDVYFVDQLSTCIPFLRLLSKKRVVFYCHFPDKLLAGGEFVEGGSSRWKAGVLKGLYRLPMDLLEELTTRALTRCSLVFPTLNTSRLLHPRPSRCYPRQLFVYAPGLQVLLSEHRIQPNCRASWDQHLCIRSCCWAG